MKKKEKSFVLTKEIVFPVGTVFTCIDGRTSRYSNDNYSASIGLTKDTSGEFVYGIDLSDKHINQFFEEIK